MLVQVCRSRHGERSREKRVRVLVLPKLGDDVKPVKTRMMRTGKFWSKWVRLVTVLQVIQGTPISVSSAPVFFASSKDVVDSPRRLNKVQFECSSYDGVSPWLSKRSMNLSFHVQFVAYHKESRVASCNGLTASLASLVALDHICCRALSALGFCDLSSGVRDT